MKRLAVWVGCVLALGVPCAHAGHLFNEGDTPQDFVSLSALEGVEVTIDGVDSDAEDGLFLIQLLFSTSDPEEGEPRPDNWSAGDILRFTMNGFSVLFDFDAPSANTTLNLRFKLSAEIKDGDPGFTEYDNQVVVNNTFTLELLEGDGVLFEGFRLADRIGATNGIVAAGIARHGDVFAVPEPCTLLLLGTGLLSCAGLRRRKAS